MNYEATTLKSNFSAATSFATIVVIPERAHNNRLYLFAYKVCTNPWFAIFITLMIIWNTIVLASDSFPVDPKKEALNNNLNRFFAYIFLAEMVIKLLGRGVRDYAREQLNLFDAAIVIISMVEIALESMDLGFAGGGAFSAFRSVRLLRTFKLVRSWKEFGKLLHKIMLTLKGLGTFLVLLLINMLIFTLTGMQLFGY